MHEAKQRGERSVTVWGTGKPLREFLFSDDMADACVFLLNLPEDEFRKLTGNPEVAPLVNVGSGRELTIAELAKKVCAVLEFSGEIVFEQQAGRNPTEVDGQLKVVQLWLAAQGFHRRRNPDRLRRVPR